MRGAGDGSPRDYQNAVKATDARALFDAVRQSDLFAAQRTMLDAARRSNVSLYTIDPRGTSVGEDTLMQAYGRPAQSGRGVATPPRANSR